MSCNNPRQNVSRHDWLRSMTLFAGILYLLYSNGGMCTVQGNNSLLDFDNDDPLLLAGRICWASFAISFAFPMFVIPAPDIILRSVELNWPPWWRCLKRPLKEGGGKKMSSKFPALTEHPPPPTHHQQRSYFTSHSWLLLESIAPQVVWRVPSRALILFGHCW